MDNIVKAKVIIELLDDRKYSVLSSFSSQELNKLNNIDLEVLDKLSNADINKTIGEFLTNIEKRKETEEVIEEPEKQTAPVKATPAPQSVKEEKKDLTIAEKIQQQPPQLIACILERIDEEKRKFVLSKLPADKKQLVENIEVESVPISDQVIGVILNELELSS